MRRLLLVPIVLLAFVLATTAAARDPRLEQLRLNPADNALAKRIVLNAADVGAGWRKTRVPESNEPLRCPGFNPDLSRFTVTGKAKTAFTQPTGASIASAVEVYESRADAIGDFRTAAKPALARCMKLMLEREFGAAGVPVRVRSARVVSAPRVGDRRIAYRVIAGLNAGGATLNLYFDVVVLQKGRSIAALFFTSPGARLPRQSSLTAAVASRMR
jgi:hypothetical protein